jgi:hypothetical protein
MSILRLNKDPSKPLFVMMLLTTATPTARLRSSSDSIESVNQKMEEDRNHIQQIRVALKESLGVEMPNDGFKIRNDLLVLRREGETRRRLHTCKALLTVPISEAFAKTNPSNLKYLEESPEG